MQARPELEGDVTAGDDENGPQDPVLAGRVLARLPALQAAEEAVAAQGGCDGEDREGEADDLGLARTQPAR